MQRMQSILPFILIATVPLAALQRVDGDEPVVRGALAEQHEDAKVRADASLKKYFDLRSSEDTDEAKIRAARDETRDAVAAALKIEFELRRQRIDAARLRLDAVEAKLAYNRKKLEELVNQQVAARLKEFAANANPHFGSPKAVLDQLAVCSDAQDFEGLVDLLTDNAANDLAGVMLMSTAGVSVMRQVAQSVSGQQAGDEFESLNQIEALVENSMRPNPPPAAAAAYAELMQAYVLAVFSQQSNDRVWPSSNLLRLSAGVLKDPRAFFVDASNAMSKLTDTPITIGEKTETRLQWKITIDGDTAIADAKSSNGSAEWNHFELRRSNGAWKIDKLFDDTFLNGLASGPQQAVSPSPIQPSGHASPFPAAPVQPTPSFSQPSGHASPFPTAPAQPTLSFSQPSGSAPAQPTPSLSQPSGSALAQPIMAAATSPPVYSAKPISWWLDKYWTSTTTLKTDPKSLDAIDVLRSQPTSDAPITRAMAKWFSSIEHELDTSRLSMVADCIVQVAGEKHQKMAVDYLFKIAEMKPPTSDDEGPTTFGPGSTCFLDSACEGITRRDGELAEQVAEHLESGGTTRRRLAIAIFVDRADESSSIQADHSTWCQDHRALLMPAMLAATRDRDAGIRTSSLICLLVIDAEHPDVAARLGEAVQSDESKEVRSTALSYLASVSPDSELLHETLLRWARSDDPQLVSPALDVMYPSDGSRKQSVEELIELLKDANWGLQPEIPRGHYGGNQFFRQYAIDLLAGHKEHVTAVLPILTKELTYKNEKTESHATAAIDAISGFTATLPVDAIQGQWEVESVTKSASEGCCLAGLEGSEKLTIKIVGTKIVCGDRVLARISHARGSSKEIVRLLADPDGRRVRCTGTYKTKGDRLTLVLSEISSETAANFRAVEKTRQTFEFRRLQP